MFVFENGRVLPYFGAMAETDWNTYIVLAINQVLLQGKRQNFHTRVSCEWKWHIVQCPVVLHCELRLLIFSVLRINVKRRPKSDKNLEKNPLNYYATSPDSVQYSCKCCSQLKALSMSSDVLVQGYYFSLFHSRDNSAKDKTKCQLVKNWACNGGKMRLKQNFL